MWDFFFDPSYVLSRDLELLYIINLQITICHEKPHPSITFLFSIVAIAKVTFVIIQTIFFATNNHLIRSLVILTLLMIDCLANQQTGSYKNKFIKKQD
jgi:hypothetical protein